MSEGPLTSEERKAIRLHMDMYPDLDGVDRSATYALLDALDQSEARAEKAERERDLARVMEQVNLDTAQEIQQELDQARADLVTTQAEAAVLFSPELLEQLAELEHERWSKWHKWAVQNWELRHPSGEMCVERWNRQAATHYSQLSETEKEADRHEARKSMAIIREAMMGQAGRDLLAHVKAMEEALGRIATGRLCESGDLQGATWAELRVVQIARDALGKEASGES